MVLLSVFVFFVEIIIPQGTNTLFIYFLLTDYFFTPTPLHGPRAQELIEKLEAGEEVDKLNYVDEEIFTHDDTVASVTAVNSMDEEQEYAVTPITQEIIDGRAY